MKNEIKFRAKCFEAYGLNKFRNFMSAPDCECGCGGKGSLILKTEEDLFGFMYNMLMDNECNCCGIFAHGYDDKMYAAIKGEYEDNEDPVDFFGVEETDTDFFKELDATCGLHCYGLLVQNHKGTWDIIEE